MDEVTFLNTWIYIKKYLKDISLRNILKLFYAKRKKKLTTFLFSMKVVLKHS